MISFRKNKRGNGLQHGGAVKGNEGQVWQCKGFKCSVELLFKCQLFDCDFARGDKPE